MSTERRNSVRGEDDKFDDDKSFEILVVNGRKRKGNNHINTSWNDKSDDDDSNKSDDDDESGDDDDKESEDEGQQIKGNIEKHKLEDKKTKKIEIGRAQV